MSSPFGSLQESLSIPQVTTNETLRELHSKDESYHAPVKPEIVVYPYNAQDVSEIMKIAKHYRRPVYPFGVGSSLEGHVIPTEDGISIDFSEMNDIIEVKEEDFLVKVQPGVTRTQLNKELKKYGLFFTVDPGADATIGGMAATNASGTSSVRYGVMRDQVRDLEVVLADGSIIHTGSLAAKSSSGYNLNSLFVGSEGTLGCFTELTIKVSGIPEHIVAGRAIFPSVDDGVEAVVSILQAGIQIARCELVDEPSIEKVNAFSDTNYAIKPTLFLEFHGNEAGLNQDVEFTKDIVNEHGCSEIEFEQDTAARNKLWEARHTLAYAFIHDAPGKKMMTTDVCVPISKLAGAIKHARKLVDASMFEGGIAGHVGDGNYHITLMFDRGNEEEIQAAAALNEEIVKYALAVGGTCTGEHGVGIGKQKYQAEEHGESLFLMEKIKQALDPESRLNPFKLVQLKN
ncbi:FAD-binding oxidoreductase [Salicibibacter kimchii]|uniref:D-lactate dehydrogenase (cytochrome) n=1 Tax=Salicibibacter kimchii TaxID=2099786 RepID=A0A345C0H8_9BACI|nr:FAD-linked oxidase C-terminal domain-containing protein [Salicibibacter kimchii]AXF56709.1 FAD-binding protein [Salicibibacter kimchii]